MERACRRDHGEPLAHGGAGSGRSFPQENPRRFQSLWQPSAESSLWPAALRDLVDREGLEAQAARRPGCRDPLRAVQTTVRALDLVFRFRAPRLMGELEA